MATLLSLACECADRSYKQIWVKIKGPLLGCPVQLMRFVWLPVENLEMDYNVPYDEQAWHFLGNSICGVCVDTLSVHSYDRKCIWFGWQFLLSSDTMQLCFNML